MSLKNFEKKKICNRILFCSEAEPKGSDCFEKFSDMNECMSKYPELYENNDEALNEAAQESVKTTNNEKEEQKEEAKS